MILCVWVAEWKPPQTLPITPLTRIAMWCWCSSNCDAPSADESISVLKFLTGMGLPKWSKRGDKTPRFFQRFVVEGHKANFCSNIPFRIFRSKNPPRLLFPALPEFAESPRIVAIRPSRRAYVAENLLTLTVFKTKLLFSRKTVSWGRRGAFAPRTPQRPRYGELFSRSSDLRPINIFS